MISGERRGFSPVLLAAAVLPCWLVGADAHVAPALDANNRYLRVTPMRDRIRLAYTVYIGELPGVQARRQMDRNRDGELDESESSGYGEELAAQVASALEITLDGTPHVMHWTESYVGLGMPVTDAGSFSIDLIGWICGRDDTGHELVLFDRYQVSQPGETEVKVQPGPGIEVTRSSLGENDASLLELKWSGEGGPLATRGLHLSYRVDQAVSEMPPGGECAAREPVAESSPSRNWLALVALMSLAVAGFSLLLWIRLRARRRSS